MVIPLVKTQTIALSCPDCPLPSFTHRHCLGMLSSHSKTLSVKHTATRRAWRHSHPSDCFFVALGPHVLQPLHSADGCSRSTQGASCRMILSLRVIWDQAGAATACAGPQAQVHGAGKWEQPFFCTWVQGDLKFRSLIFLWGDEAGSHSTRIDAHSQRRLFHFYLL